MSRKKTEETPHEEHADETWLIPYSDLLTLLLALFIVLFASSSLDKAKMEQITNAFSAAFSTLPSDQANGTVLNFLEEANNLALGDNVGLGSYPQGAMLEIANGVFFENNTTTITAEGKEILKKISALLSSPKYQRYRIIVEGHTDDSQPDSNLYPSNWELSSVMASTIIRELINNGLSENRFQAVGMADIAPKNPNRNIYGEAIPINRKLNNRIVIKIEI